MIRMTIQGKHLAHVNAHVDAGATFTMVPHRLAKRVGLPLLKGIPVRLANGRFEEMPQSTALITVAGRTVPATILVSSNGYVRLGARSLDALGMTLDSREHRLKVTQSATVMAA